jgi:hypothetical protein
VHPLTPVDGVGCHGVNPHIPSSTVVQQLICRGITAVQECYTDLFLFSSTTPCAPVEQPDLLAFMPFVHTISVSKLGFCIHGLLEHVINFV